MATRHDQPTAQQGTKQALLCRLAAIEDSLLDTEQYVLRDLPATRTVPRLQRIRTNIAAFEVALMRWRLRHLAARAAGPTKRPFVGDITPLIVRRAIERRMRQGRIKWSSN